jgi:hypothetical protein
MEAQALETPVASWVVVSFRYGRFFHILIIQVLIRYEVAIDDDVNPRYNQQWPFRRVPY